MTSTDPFSVHDIVFNKNQQIQKHPPAAAGFLSRQRVFNETHRFQAKSKDSKTFPTSKRFPTRQRVFNKTHRFQPKSIDSKTPSRPIIKIYLKSSSLACFQEKSSFSNKFKRFKNILLTHQDYFQGSVFSTKLIVLDQNQQIQLRTPPVIGISFKVACSQ